jgi:hypothetical protein
MKRKRSPHLSGLTSLVLAALVATLGCRTAADDIQAEARQATPDGTTLPGQSTGEERKVPSLAALAPLPELPEPQAPVQKPAPEPTPKPEAAEAERPAKPRAPLAVKRFVIASGVAKREPVGAAKRFQASKTERLYGFVELVNEAREASSVTVTFAPPTGAPVRVKLDVRGERRFRTWATTRKLKTSGTWSATVTSEDGRVLARTTFEIER